MKRPILVLSTAAITSGLFAVGFRLVTPTVVVAQSNTNLVVSAAASLKEPLDEIKPLYQQTQPNINVSYNFGASGALQQQIEKGAPSDIYISTAKNQVDALEEKGMLVPKTRGVIANNRLVLIVPKSHSIGITSFYTLADPKVKKIAIGEPKNVPSGRYAEQVFKKLGIFEKVKPKLVYVDKVSQVLASVESGNADAGLGYATDAKVSNKVKVAVAADGKFYSPIIYPVAVLKNSSNVEAAKEFIKFLSSEQAKVVLKKYGFIVNVK
jgi:molybdate transport system substrate-binding protein